MKRILSSEFRVARLQGYAWRGGMTLATLAFVVCQAMAQGVTPAADEPTLGKTWAETQVANPEQRGAQTGRGLTPLSSEFYEYKDGVYRSVVSRISIRLPRLSDEKQVSVRESVISRRPDGSPITTHLIFVPGSLGMESGVDTPVSALVVTRLRDDRPKNRDSVLRNFEPPTDEHRAQMEKVGILHSRVQTPLGEALQRVIPNRVFVEPFPYQSRSIRQATLKTIGITRFVVIEEDSLIEFSQIFHCKEIQEQECRQAALLASDRFIAGVVLFKAYPR